ncbi:MAG: STAS domain-containing protein [SAR324 cluster bacterium]|nr:STAS domain-containing protein [SAR324 cluster bacterium]
MKIAHSLQKQICIVTVEGAIVGKDVFELGMYLTALPKKEGCTAIVLNLKDTTHLDSSAIGTFLMLFQMFKEKGIKFALSQLNKRIVTISEIIRLDKLIPIYSTEQKAISYLAPPAAS